MGRKSTAKTQTKASSANAGGGPLEPPKRAALPLAVIAVIVVAAIAGIVVATRPSQAPPAAATQTTPAAAPPVEDVEPPSAKFGPHKQAQLPPLPYEPMAARPPDVVRAAYLFAAEHPVILAYVPCYCGCERSGHRGNDDCFVAARDANGDVTQWEPHGAT